MHGNNRRSRPALRGSRNCGPTPPNYGTLRNCGGSIGIPLQRRSALLNLRVLHRPKVLQSVRRSKVFETPRLMQQGLEEGSSSGEHLVGLLMSWVLHPEVLLLQERSTTITRTRAL